MMFDPCIRSNAYPFERSNPLHTVKSCSLPWKLRPTSRIFWPAKPSHALLMFNSFQKHPKRALSDPWGNAPGTTVPTHSLFPSIREAESHGTRLWPTHGGNASKGSHPMTDENVDKKCPTKRSTKREEEPREQIASCRSRIAWR